MCATTHCHNRWPILSPSFFLILHHYGPPTVLVSLKKISSNNGTVMGLAHSRDRGRGCWQWQAACVSYFISCLQACSHCQTPAGDTCLRVVMAKCRRCWMTQGGQGGHAPSASRHTAYTDDTRQRQLRPARVQPCRFVDTAGKTHDHESNTCSAIVRVPALNASFMCACLAPAWTRAYPALVCACLAVSVLAIDCPRGGLKFSLTRIASPRVCA